MSLLPEKAPFNLKCSMCGFAKQLAKVVARKGHKRIRICENCDLPTGANR